MQGAPGSIHADGGPIVADVYVQPQIRVARVHIGASAAVIAEPVGHGVLELQGRVA